MQVHPGSQWFDEIVSALNEVEVAVLLVTPNFLASDFIHEHELGPLLKEAEQDGVTILWVPIRESAYKQTALKNYQSVWRRLIFAFPEPVVISLAYGGCFSPVNLECGEMGICGSRVMQFSFMAHGWQLVARINPNPAFVPNTEINRFWHMRRLNPSSMVIYRFSKPRAFSWFSRSLKASFFSSPGATMESLFTVTPRR
jgi:hypothetical protein